MLSLIILSYSSSFCGLMQFTQHWESQDASLLEMALVTDSEGCVKSQVGDINGDGIEDFFIIMDEVFSNERGIKAVSGVNGSLLWSEDFSYFGSSFWSWVSVGKLIYETYDLNNDGCSDLILNISVYDNSGYSETYFVAISSRDGGILWAHTAPYEISQYNLSSQPELFIAEDMNNDGFNDICVSWSDDINTILCGIDGRLGYELWRKVDSGWYPNNINVLGMTGDMDSDGLNDIMMIEDDSWGGVGIQEIVVASSSTGNYIWSNAATYSYEENLTSSIDVNNDSLNDFIFRNSESSNGLSANGGLIAYDGADGSQLWQITGIENDESWRLRNGSDFVGDLDQDGISDFIIDKADKVKAYSGATGNVLWSFDAPHYYPPVLYSRIRPFDVDGDGTNDLFFSDPLASTNGLNQNGSMQMISGADGTTLWSAEGSKDYSTLGFQPCILRDVNNDGYPDIGVSELDNRTPTSVDGYLLVLSGLTGAALLPQHFLGQVFSEEDINNDGYADVWRQLIIGVLGDLTGDGVDEFGTQMISSFNDFNSHLSTTKAYTSTPSLTVSNAHISSSIGGNIDYQINFGPSANSYEYRMLMSFTQGTTPIGTCLVNLGYDLWMGKTYLGQWPSVFSNTSGFLDAVGMSLVQLSTSQVPASLIGTTIYFAAIARMPWDGWSRASNTVDLEIVQ